MVRAGKTCSMPGCPNIVPAGARDGRCGGCKGEAEQRRGTAYQRGYGGPGHDAFSSAVIGRDPTCVVCKARPSKHADHHWVHPLSGVVYDRRALVAAHLNPNDPRYGRGTCHQCHSSETAEHQPGGWNAR